MKKDIIQVGLGAALLLLIPFVVGQLSAEVNWDLADFIIMGGLLFVAGLGFKLAMRLDSFGQKSLVTIAIILVFLYIWAELAVGIFNIPGISGS